MKKILFTIVCLFAGLILLEAQSVSGTWTYNSGNFPITMLLLDNGTGEFQGLPVKYRTQDGKLYIDDGVQPMVYNYQLTQTSLTLSGGGLQVAIVFTKPGSSSGNSAPVTQQNYNQANTGYGNANNNQSGNTNNFQSGNTNNSQTGNTNNYQSGSANNSQSGNMAGMAGNTTGQAGSGSGILGIWDGPQGKVIFYPDGTLIYNGTGFQYNASGNSITITGTDGSTSFNYNLAGNQLTMSQNANSAVYTKTSALKPDVVDPQLVGKWCIMANNNNNYSGGGSSSEECITLNENGTYEYSYSSSRTAYSADQSSYGGTANQNSDRGTWKSDGLTILSVSQTTGKTSRYSLGKVNVQTGDPAIVLGGRRFVTAWNRPKW
jgi:YD repeat-containing protein